MAEAIKCPVCGENNPPDQEYCRKCNSPLQPFGVAAAGPSFTPGQIPTKKNTAELEPILPQWLRDARDQARKTAQEDAAKPSSPPPAEPHAPGLDLLAGLKSQAGDEDEEETPDWLASITGVSNKSKKTTTESSEVRWVELGGKDEPVQSSQGSQEDETPSWLSGLQSQPASEKDEMSAWLSQGQSGAVKDESPEWLNPIAGPDTSSSDEAPDWLKQMDVDASSKTGGESLQKADSFPNDDIPSWLDSMDQNQGAAPAAFVEPASVESDAGISSADTPDWLKGIDSTPAASPQSDDDWLKGLQGDAGITQDAGMSPLPSFEQSAETPAEESFEGDVAFGEIPSWLKAAAPQSSIFSEPAPEQTESYQGDTPDWLSAFKSVDSSQPSTPFSADNFSNNQAAPDADVPAFTPDAFANGSDGALFTEMPDWLSNAAGETPLSASEPAATAADSSIAPGQLPSWVQAMRPTDTSSAGRSGPLSADSTLETRGALAGLQGVLPAVPGYVPTSKPRAYSIKLQSTNEQQAHAVLLEQILAAEAEPQPIASFSPLVASPSLRWLLTLAFLVVLPAVLFLRTQIFTMPFIAVDQLNPRLNALSGALFVAQNVTESAPVLVVIDYQPATAGELEVASVPMFDQMDLLRHPRLVFISTNEMGTILTERLISQPSMRDRYRGEGQFSNLGYLPGGEMGIRAFVQNPLQTMPSGSSALQQNISINQFVAVIIMTDNASSARTWVEQLTAAQYPASVVFITSAQAAPMLQPYYETGQVTGIVNGLQGGAVFEQNNVNRPGTARNYWDAYSLGTLLAAAMITIGGLWNLFAGLRNRSMTGAAG